MATQTSVPVVSVPVEDIIDKEEVKVMDDETCAPKRGEILGSFSSFSLGLVWVVPNVRDTDMLTTIPVYHFLEEKIFYSLNLDKEESHCSDPTTVELYKVENCNDVHLRAINAGIYEDELEPMDSLTPDYFVFGASIINEGGETIQEEKICRSYMLGGKRHWDIHSFICAPEFDIHKLLTSCGDLHLRMTFYCKMLFPLIKSIIRSETQTVGPNDITDPGSNSNANLDEKLKNCAPVTAEDLNRTIAISRSYFAQVALEGFPSRLKNLMKREKFTDGIIIVTPLQENGNESESRTFPIHRAILSAHSHGFESAFECEKEFKFTKYSIHSIEILLHYIYTGELICDKRLSILSELIEIADEMKVIGLKDRCIQSSLDADNTIYGGITCYKLALKYNSTPLKLAAVNIFNKHKDILMESPDFQHFVHENNLEELFFPMFE